MIYDKLFARAVLLGDDLKRKQFGSTIGKNWKTLSFQEQNKLSRLPYNSPKDQFKSAANYNRTIQNSKYHYTLPNSRLSKSGAGSMDFINKRWMTPLESNNRATKIMIQNKVPLELREGLRHHMNPAISPKWSDAMMIKDATDKLNKNYYHKNK